MLHILILSFLALLCCSKKEKGDLTFMVGGTPNDFALWENVISDFKEKSGIEVKLIRSATQTEMRKQQIFIALRGKKADPDVIVMDIAWIGQLAASQWLEPLEKYDIDTGAFFNNIVRLADMHNSNLIGLPLYVDAGLLYYRKDLLEKYGYTAPPKTWQQLIDMSIAIQQKERKSNPDFWGFVWQGAQYEGLICNALEFFTSAGGGFFNQQTTPTIQIKENNKALNVMVDLIHKYKISPPNTYTDMKEEEVRMVFHNSNALFERNWPYASKLHAQEDAAVKGKFGLTVLPHFEGHNSAATLGGWHIGVSAFSDRKKDAAEFVKYVTSFAVQKKLLLELGHNPGRKDVYDDPEVKTDYLGSLKEILLTAVPRPMVPYYSEVSLVLQKHINNALARNVSADEALARAHEEIENIVTSHGQQ